jgi:hypothetical protein
VKRWILKSKGLASQSNRLKPGETMNHWPYLPYSALRLALASATLALIGVAVEPIHAQAPFFQGKTVTIIQGRDPGGTGDARTKALVPFLQKYLPGNPTVMMEYMPGAGGRMAANHLYRTAKPDGLTIGNPSIGMISAAILGEPGVQYDIDKFSYLGSPYSEYHSVFLSRHEAGFSSVEKLQAASGVRIGAQSVGFVTYNEGRLFAYLLGLKEPRFVAAYSGAELDPALIRGEIDARATGADSITQRNKEWLEKGSPVDFHAILEVPKGNKHGQFPQLREIESFAKSDLESWPIWRAVLESPARLSCYRREHRRIALKLFRLLFERPFRMQISRGNIKN